MLALACTVSLVDPQGFLANVKTVNDFILQRFGPVYSIAVLFFLVLVVAVYFTPLGKTKIGSSPPLLSKWRWFSITLCTTIATGILFWGTAEPLFHFHQPPPSAGVLAASVEAEKFAMSTMFMHWTFLPYSIYTLVALVFALNFYNRQQPFSLSSVLYPVLGRRSHLWPGKVVDALALFSLITGMAASLGAGLIILAAGIETIIGVPYSNTSLALVSLAVVGTFIISAASGLMRGIRTLSDINIKLFIALAIFVFVAGPTLFILKSGFSGILEFFLHFFRRSLIGVVNSDIEWSHSWTMFYWANWLAWTPITALFLGRIAQGYTVREFIRINLLYPSLFAIAWMSIFSSTSVYFDTITSGFPLFEILNTSGGPSKVLFEILNQLPWTTITSLFFLFAAFLSYVTAADSNTSAMSSISIIGFSKEQPESPIAIKIIWGSMIGVIAWVMISFGGENGLDGIRMLSNLGGFPVLFLVILTSIGLVRMVINSYSQKK